MNRNDMNIHINSSHNMSNKKNIHNQSNNNNPQKMNYKNNIKFKEIFFNIISLVFLLFFLYKFILGLTLDGLYGLIVSFVISFLISSFVLNKFKYSNNKFIRILKKLVMYNIIIFVVIITCNYFNIEISSKI